MSLFAAWVVYPLVLLALCAGLGLLVDVLCGRRLPGALVPPAGLAAMVVVGEFTTWTDGTAELTVPLILLLAVLGVGLSIPWRFGRPDPLPIAVAVGVFLVFGAPVILSGHPTFAGYIKLDDTATWLAMTDRIMEHGRSLSGLEASSYYATLKFNLAGGYPLGVFVPFGTAQKLVGGDLAWVFQPYLSLLASMLSLAIWQIFAIVRRPGLRAAAAFIAAQPALLYGYAMWGGIKELGAAALVALGAALAPLVLRDDGRSPWSIDHSGVGSMDQARAVLASSRVVLPLALAAGALVGVLSAGGIVWFGPLLLALAVIAYRRFGLRPALLLAAAFVVLTAIFVLPAVTSGLVPPTTKSLVGSNGEGNLRGPLSIFQALGIWPSGDFRFHPDGTVVTAVLVALAIGAAAFGLWTAWRRRAAAPLLYASALIAGLAIFLLGSPWAAGKALATASPIGLSLAALGALAALRLDRFAGGILIVVVAGGVLWSNVLAYGGVSLAPYGELVELQEIGKQFAHEGPTLMTEYNPYGARHFLREENGEGASELRVRAVPLKDGGEVEKGYAVDTDELDMAGLFEFRTLVLRRSPVKSRPPSPYRLVRTGKYYEVWQRPEGQTAPPEHLPLGSEFEPSAVPDCGEIAGLGLLMLQHGASSVHLVAAHHAPVYDATDGNLEVPVAGRYTAWLLGSTRGSLELFVDGRKTGEARQQIENEGGYIELGTTDLSAGHHTAELRFGGADLHPGSGGFPRTSTGPLLFVPVEEDEGELISVPLDESDRLCGKPWDWIEALEG